MTTVKHKRIYNLAAIFIEQERLSRSELVDKVYSKLTSSLSFAEKCDIGCATSLRGEIGSVIDEMEANGFISYTGGVYTLKTQRPVILRSESCEREIISALRTSPMTKSELHKELEEIFGTKLTPTQRDDNILSSLLGSLLKRLLSLGIIVLRDNVYAISPKKEAKIDDIHAILALKEEFLIRIHSKGGEYFEHYFMTLLGKYMSKHGKTVKTNKVSGGAQDGGIDGIMETVDSLGFRETVMVQMKNRLEETNETSVRGFWGSVCAYQGSRGIFATTSSFHPMAKEFLDNIDSCIGLDGTDIFKMACECQYGIRKRNGKYTIDNKVI